MVELNSAEKIRIKDIAKKAGVSVGTVDRVLHDRPNVSKRARVKVENVLKKINYQPNMYASALATNKKYKFYAILPIHTPEGYWTEIEKGIKKSIQNRSDFHLSMTVTYYNQFDPASFIEASSAAVSDETDGVIVVPQEYEVTKSFCDKLTAKGIPFIFLDSNFSDINALTFYGQDSIKSGYFAARVFMMQASRANEIMLMKQVSNGRVASKQQQYREIGFRQYIMEYYPDCKIHELTLILNENDNYDNEMDKFFEEHPTLQYGITFCSRAFIVGEYLLRNNRRGFHLLGYDMIKRNVECLKEGSIDFLIAQHPFHQGYGCVKAMFNHLVMRKQISRENYMPIELITAENYNFYIKQNF